MISKFKTLIYFFILYLSCLAHGRYQCNNLFNNDAKYEDLLKLGVIQYPLEENSSYDSFLKKVDHYIKISKKNGSELIVLPELITTELVNWSEPEIPQLEYIARNITPKYKAWLKLKALENNISILGGTTPQYKGKKIFNTALLALSDGRLLEQDKIFLTPDEKNWNWTPGKTLNIFDTRWGKMAILICFDSEFPFISQKISASKPDLILIPSWTSSQSGFNRVDWSARARAIEHYAYVVKTGTVQSKTSTQPHFGNATIFGPQDHQFPTEPQSGRMNKKDILFQEIDLNLLRNKKEISGYNPSLEQQKRTDRIIKKSQQI